MKQPIHPSEIRGSAAFRALNPGLFAAPGAPPAPVSTEKGTKTSKSLPKVKKLTKPERVMEAMLSTSKRAGVLQSFAFEGITLKLGDDCRYTPDFSAFRLDTGKLICYECKGPFIREDAMVKFKTAKTIFPMIEFQMWQLQKGGDFERIL